MLSKWMSGKSSMHETVKKSNATFKFGIDDVKEIEKWHPHLKYQQSRLYSDFKGWRRMGFMLSVLMSVIPVFKYSTRLMAYKIEF
jgi:hypothetical protein